MAGLGENLDDVSAVQLESQRDHAAIDLCSDTGVANFGMHRIREIDWRGISRQDHDFSFWGEGVDLFGKEVDFEGGEELGGIADVPLPLHYLTQP